MANDPKLESQKPQVPYVSFTTLKGLVERMHKEGGVPARVDRSYLTGMSGGYQVQILMALKVIGLIDDDSVPTDRLREITANPEKSFVPYLQEQIDLLYPEMIELGNKNGTALQLADLFRSKFNLSGSTLTGAIRFFLEACKFAGVKVGAHFKTPPRVKGNTARKTSARRAPVVPAIATVTGESPIVGGMANTLRTVLPSGGYVTLSTYVDVTQLTSSERTFVFDLIDKVKNYEAEQPKAVTATVLPEFEEEDEGEKQDNL